MTTIQYLERNAYIDDDTRAETIGDIMQSSRGPELAKAIVERVQLISSVNWLGNHVPICVLNRLGQEIRLRHVNDSTSDDSSTPGEDSTDRFSQRSHEAIQEGEISVIRTDDQDKLQGVEDARIGAPLTALEEDEEDRPSSTENEDSYRTALEIHDQEMESEPERSIESESEVMPRNRSAAVHRESFTSFGGISALSGDWGTDSDNDDDFNTHGNEDGDSLAHDLSLSVLHFSDNEVSVEQPIPPYIDKKSSVPFRNNVGTEHIIRPKSAPTDQTLRLPYATTHECAILLVDISGFTKLSTLLDPESLSKAINGYFQLIVNQVTAHGGDVLKFAGDAVFAEWQASTDHSKDATSDLYLPHTAESRRRITLAECVAAAATCGAKIVKMCSDYPVFANGATGRKENGAGVQVATLDVHCGLGAGKVIGIHVGNDYSRREYFIIGDPIEQVSSAMSSAALGELFASPQALVIMSTRGQLLDESLAVQGTEKPVLIARKGLSGFTPKLPKQQRRCSVTHLWEGWDSELLTEYRKLICLYTHPVVVANEMAVEDHLRAMSTAQQRHFEEAEIRGVYVMFISMPRVVVKVTGNVKEDAALFTLLNNIMNLTTRELDRFSGHLRQLMVDDKGLVLIATFGLRGSTSPNMITARALPATNVIHNALQTELGVFNRIGATFGNAYCGVVGGLKRHEYAVMGPSVNLAARLMCSPRNPGILVDGAVCRKAGKSYAFSALAPVKAKGYPEPVQIFEPLCTLTRGWGRAKSDFVGRRDEIVTILGVAKDMVSRNSPSKMVFVTADSGTGKTSMVVHAVEHLRKLMNKTRKRFFLAKHVCKDSDVLVPFSMFRSIFMDILNEVDGWTDNKSVTSASAGSISGIESLGEEWDGVSSSSGTSLSSASSSSRSNRLLSLFNEMDASSEFVELVGHHLLGLDVSEIHATREDHAKLQAPSPISTMNFMASAFHRCTKRAQLVIIAVDDVHLMDEMSWNVMQKLFSSVRNLMFICTSRPLTTCKLNVDAEFWNELTLEHKLNGRFIPIELKRLGEKDIGKMIAKKLGLEEHEVCQKFQRDVFHHSTGMPHFANEILLTARQQNSVGRHANNRVGWTDATEQNGIGVLSFPSVGDLIIHRLDSLDAKTRNVLNVGAVLGYAFDLKDVVAVMHHLVGATAHAKSENTKKIRAALERLAGDGILVEVCAGGETDDNGEDGGATHPPASNDSDTISISLSSGNRTYTFCHKIWRSTILHLMLDSHKRNIHRTIATILDGRQGNISDDYLSMMKRFSHWKANGNTTKAAMLALEAGKCFVDLGLQNQSIRLYEETLGMWRTSQVASGESNGAAGFPMSVLGDLSALDLEYIIKVHIALGQCLANIHKGKESVVAYQDALMILQAAPASQKIQDRTIVFPIFSGLFLALKFGQIEQDSDCTYEQGLVRRFVDETKLNGDPVHFCRALAMQADMYGRLGQFDKAFETFEELQNNYDVEYSDAICNSYGSDRCAQCYGLSALWHLELGNKEKAILTCRFVIDSLMPHMPPRNVHNSCVILYPVCWVMKDCGMALDAKNHFERFVVKMFEQHCGDGAFTFCLPLYKPVMMLLDLAGHPGGTGLGDLESYIDWALHEDNLRFGMVINNAMGNMGRCCNSISAEISLLLARVMEAGEKKIKLIRNGLAVAREAMEFCRSKRMIPAQSQVKPVLDALESLAADMEIGL